MRSKQNDADDADPQNFASKRKRAEDNRTSNFKNTILLFG